MIMKAEKAYNIYKLETQEISGISKGLRARAHRIDSVWFCRSENQKRQKIDVPALLQSAFLHVDVLFRPGEDHLLY